MPSHFRVAAIVAVLCLMSAVLGRASRGPRQSSGTQAVQDFPAGPNRDVVVKACKECHPVSQITRRHESRARWSFLVDQMIKEGADIRDEDFDKIVSYLSVALGKKVKINEASAKVVAETFDIEDELAAAIVKYRTEKGPFKEWKDLLKVPGVDPQRIEEQKDNLDFSAAFGLPPAGR